MNVGGGREMGRPKTPPELQKAKGYPGRRKAATDAMIDITDVEPIAPSNVRKPPASLDKVGRDKWIELSDLLTRMMLIKATDYDTLHMYCAAWSDLIKIRRDLKRRWVVKTVSAHVNMDRRNPLAAEHEKKRREVSELARDLGLTPATRLSMQTRLADVTNPKKGRYAGRAAAQPATGAGQQPQKPASPIGILKSNPGQRPN